MSSRQIHNFVVLAFRSFMRSSYVFLGTFIICLVMCLSANAGQSFSPHHQKYKCAAAKAFSVSASSEALPVNESEDIPKIDVTASNNSLTTYFSFRNIQELFCLFEILFELEKIEHYQPRIPVTLNNFFLHLFRVIISPNAP